jgi:hypothetical protein
VRPCAGRATIRAGDARRVRPCVEHAALVADQHAGGVCQLLEDIAAPRLPPGLRVSVRTAQQILEALGGGGLAADVCHLPTVCALGLTEHALQIRLRPVAGLGARTIGRQPPGHVCQVGLGARHGASRRIRHSQRGERSRFSTPLQGSVLPAGGRNPDTSFTIVLPL